jgi:prepilin-type N-terminal cleavage/methylation domain-containing protein
MKKIKAFTLMELIIGMIIGSIVVGFCYTGYRMILKQYLDFKKTKTEIGETMQFNTALRNDFVNAQTISYNENHLVMLNDSSKIEYEFAETFILRDVKDVSDTFHLKPKEIQPVFLSEINENLIIQGFSFNAEILGEKEIFQYQKNYSADFLMQLSKKQDNGD